MTDNIDKFYYENGYAIINNVLTLEEVNEMKNILKYFKNTKHFTDSMEKKLFMEQGVIIGLSRKNEYIRSVAYKPQILENVRKVLGGKISFVIDKIIIKNKKYSFDSPWHQDWPYLKGPHKVSVWIALDDTKPENGCLKVVPGTHTKEIDHVGYDGYGFTKQVDVININDNNVIDLPINAGSAIVIHDMLLHASNRNTSGEDRDALVLTYKNISWNFKNFPNIIES